MVNGLQSKMLLRSNARKSIMVIDNNDNRRNRFVKNISGEGVEVVQLSNASEAFSMIQLTDTMPDYLFVSNDLQGIDAATCLRILHRMEKLAGTLMFSFSETDGEFSMTGSPAELSITEFALFSEDVQRFTTAA